MHKRFVNHCTIDLTISPCGPILIKSGKEGADPTKPDLEFVETYHQGERTIYLPGSGLKGAIRSHAERIIRTVGSEKRPSDPQKLWANDPLNDDYKYLKNTQDKFLASPEIYHKSSFTDRLFGNIALASRLRIEDAYPLAPKGIKLEERNGVAIDRVFGSAVRGALFNYQVCIGGEFNTKIHLKNFTLAQLGLIGLVLRDLDDGWFGLGFAKSRGMGTVEVKLNSAIVQYPGCIIENNQIKLLGNNSKLWNHNQLLGVGEFVDSDDINNYGFDFPDQIETPIGGHLMDLGLGVKQQFIGEEAVKTLFMRSVSQFSKKVQGVAA
jgi:CRISPR-associated RAMP protein (TIGR02581 family)